MKGDKGWIGLAIGISVFDAIAEETMSEAFWRALQNPKKCFVPIACWAVVTLHLFRPWTRIPRKFDPIHYTNVRRRVNELRM